MVSVVLVVVLLLAGVVWRTATVRPLVTVPAELVKAAPSMLYSPPVTLIGVATLMPATVMALEVTMVLCGTLLWAVKLKASGVVSLVPVVTSKLPVTPPIFSTALTVVLALEEEVSLTSTICPLLTVPALLVKTPPLMRYWPPPPLTLIGLGVSMPLTVMALEVTITLVATPVWPVKVKAFGVVSPLPVVTLKVDVTPPTFSVALVKVCGLEEDVTRTQTVSLLLTLPLAVVKLPVQPML